MAHILSLYIHAPNESRTQECCAANSVLVIHEEQKLVIKPHSQTYFISRKERKALVTAQNMTKYSWQNQRILLCLIWLTWWCTRECSLKRTSLYKLYLLHQTSTIFWLSFKLSCIHSLTGAVNARQRITCNRLLLSNQLHESQVKTPTSWRPVLSPSL
jgi:hypothetical protein